MSRINYRLLQYDKLLLNLFVTGIETVQPEKLIKEKVTLNGTCLTVMGKKYELKKPVKMIGFGIAAHKMAIAIEDILGDQLEWGRVAIPAGITTPEIPRETKIKFLKGLPENIPLIAEIIRGRVRNLKADDIVIVLHSGEESLLLTLPRQGIEYKEKVELFRRLKEARANSIEMNYLRRQFSDMKGGGLAQACHPATVINLILSDVMGDCMEEIADGSMYFNTDNPFTACALLMKYNLAQDMPKCFYTVLKNNINRRLRPEHSIKNRRYLHVDSFVIGNSITAVLAIHEKAEKFGFQSIIICTTVSLQVEIVAKIYVSISRLFSDYLEGNIGYKELKRGFTNLKPPFLQFHKDHELDYKLAHLDRIRPFCLIFAGYPVIMDVEEGGGRNRHLAFCFAKGVKGFKNPIFFLSCATGGFDEGDTDAAGAFAHSTLIEGALVSTNLKTVIEENKSHSFYNSYLDGRYLIKMGYTGTKVMDIHILLVCPNN